jgi:diguanylate cyclase (GGDEF)-like protein
VAGVTSGRDPVNPTSGTTHRQQHSIAPVSETMSDEQTLADRDQSFAEADQTGSERDQTAAGREQAAADRDQAASDRDLARGGDPEVHHRSREVRERSAQQRRYSAQQRVETADSRDRIARSRDLVGSARDHASEVRDLELRTYAGSAGEDAEIVRRAAEDRRSAAVDRAAAAQRRAWAAADRGQAARDREHATRDRLQGREDRDELRHQLALAQTDGLTGTRARATGLEALDHEVERARRTMAPLVVGYVDVVGLKTVNDTHGHAAGDALLQHAVRAIRGHLRSYDLIVRIGGDEFLCVMSGATIDDAEHRFNVIQAGLAADPDRCEIRVGFAALAAEDSASELIRRADAELPTSRRL